jgi:hydroxymethylbilane synthase
VIRIGTRGSALALVQAHAVQAALGRVGLETDIVTITTAGDRGQDIGDKARWTSALERALLQGEIDLAVHSAKDVPGEIADGTAIVAIPERQDPRDALCGCASLATLAPGARVGTSSVRRAAQIHALREDIEVVKLRGNVDTRLRRLAEGELDAVVLAQAGLMRLGRESEIGCLLDECVPAPGQGALIVQARADDERAAVINDPAAERCVLAERALASHLGATCATPLGASAVPASAVDVTLRAWIGLPDGSHWIADELTSSASLVGAEMAQRMVAAGARELLVRAVEMASA